MVLEALAAAVPRGDEQVTDAALRLLHKSSEHEIVLDRTGDTSESAFYYNWADSFEDGVEVWGLLVETWIAQNPDLRDSSKELFITAVNNIGDVKSLIPELRAGVRQITTGFLEVLAQSTNPGLLSTLLQNLQSQDVGAHTAALRVVDEMKQKSLAQLLAEVVQRLEDEDGHVHQAAAVTLRELAQQGDRDLISSALPRLKDNAWQSAAVQLAS